MFSPFQIPTQHINDAGPDDAFDIPGKLFGEFLSGRSRQIHVSPASFVPGGFR